MKTTIIMTNTNLEDEIRTIKALESKLEELKELKEEKESIVKKSLMKPELKNYRSVLLRYVSKISYAITSTHLLLKRNILNYTMLLSNKAHTENSVFHESRGIYFPLCYVKVSLKIP